LHGKAEAASLADDLSTGSGTNARSLRRCLARSGDRGRSCNPIFIASPSGYVIFFRYEDDTFLVVNVLEGHRDIVAYFRDDPD
jgi:hypothetical protein